MHYRTILFFLLAISHAAVQAQQASYRLQDILELARKNHPQVRQLLFVSETNKLAMQNSGKAALPQLSLNGQATYQSDVTSIPISLPGMDIPALSRDQYRLYADVNQTLYDGGLLKSQKNVILANAAAEEQKVQVELYAIRERLIQHFFNVLLCESQLKQNALYVKELDASLARAEASYNSGVTLKSHIAVIKAERIRAQQRAAETRSVRRSSLASIGLFTGRELDDSTSFEKPAAPAIPGVIQRPELKLLEYQGTLLGSQQELIRSRNRPRLNLFAQAGVGRPALNMLSNDFETYYIAGIRFNWTLTGLYTMRKDMKINELTRRSLEVHKDLFLLSFHVQSRQQLEEIAKLREVIASDNEIISLLGEIQEVSRTQFNNGVLQATDLLRDMNALLQARENAALHETQLLMALYRLENNFGQTTNEK